MEFCLQNLEKNIVNFHDCSYYNYSFHTHSTHHSFYGSSSILVYGSIDIYTAKTVIQKNNAINLAIGNTEHI